MTLSEYDQIVEEVAVAMQHHLPMELPENDAKHPGWTMCLCHSDEGGDGLSLFQGPVYHRLHVARAAVDALRSAGFEIVKSDG